MESEGESEGAAEEVVPGNQRVHREVGLVDLARAIVGDVPPRLSWGAASQIVIPYLVQIHKPTGSGTGFYIRSNAENQRLVVTAAHVVGDPNYYEQVIALEHKLSGKTARLRDAERAIICDFAKDTAIIIFNNESLPFPEEVLSLVPVGTILPVGTKLGWMGYPPGIFDGPCFQSGRVSAYREPTGDYLVDGVTLSGCSGGPAFTICSGKVRVAGVISAYKPNRSKGEVQPGLGVISSIEPLYHIEELLISPSEEENSKPPPKDRL